MAIYDNLLDVASYPFCDKLTGLLASSFVGDGNEIDQNKLEAVEATREEKDGVAIMLLHIILDLQATQDDRPGELLREG
jgi:hypothetical protein